MGIDYCLRPPQKRLPGRSDEFSYYFTFLVSVFVSFLIGYVSFTEGIPLFE